MITKANRLPHVRAAIYGQPWMIKEEYLRAICEIFERAVAGVPAVDFEAKKPAEDPDDMIDRAGYVIYPGGVAIVDLMGPIFPRANLMTNFSGATSAEEFRNNFSRAIDDPDVESVILRVDSPGGAVSGIFEAASLVYSARNSGKDIVTICEGTMASAAYLIGSQASAVYATEASVVGSIGVVMQIEDDTRQRQNEGLDTYTLKTGPLKAVGAGPVTGEQIDHMRDLLNDYFGRFKQAVGRARMGIDVDAVSTGAVFIGRKAEDMRLIDGIASTGDLVTALGGGDSLNDFLNK